MVVNATDYTDLDTVVLGLLDAEADGQSFVYRCGPSFVRARGSIAPAPQLSAEALYERRGHAGHGLVLVGSHVETTTRQLERALELDGVHGRRAVRRAAARGPASASRRSRRRWGRSSAHLPEREVILYTSRELARAEGADEALDVGRSVSDALVELVQRLDPRAARSRSAWPRAGSPASDIGSRGFGVRRAEVAGADAAGPDLGLVPSRRLRLSRSALRDLSRQRRREGTLAEAVERLGPERDAPRNGAGGGRGADRAVGAFTCYDLLASGGGPAAASRPRRSRAGQLARRSPRPEASGCSRRSAPRPSAPPVSVLVQLDHVADPELIAPRRLRGSAR